MTEPTKQELAEMVYRLAWEVSVPSWEEALRLLGRWHHSQLVFVTTPRPWSVE